MSFELIPAIDIAGGRCVRLRQGRYEDETVYADDPLAVAERWAGLGARRLHLVDLDGAKAGRPVHAALIETIARKLPVPVQVGGGIRTLDDARRYLEAGVDRVILGSVAAKDPELVATIAAAFPGRVAVGIDARDGWVAVEGWTETSRIRAEDLAVRMRKAGVCCVIHTDIARDGMLTGPNVEAACRLAEQAQVPVIVSGGIATIEDVRAVWQARKRGIVGAITGRAIYEGTLNLPEALAELRDAE